MSKINRKKRSLKIRLKHRKRDRINKLRAKLQGASESEKNSIQAKINRMVSKVG